MVYKFNSRVHELIEEFNLVCKIFAMVIFSGDGYECNSKKEDFVSRGV